MPVKAFAYHNGSIFRATASLTGFQRRDAEAQRRRGGAEKQSFLMACGAFGENEGEGEMVRGCHLINIHPSNRATGQRIN